jgi:hypothetical protein
LSNWMRGMVLCEEGQGRKETGSESLGAGVSRDGLEEHGREGQGEGRVEGGIYRRRDVSGGRLSLQREFSKWGWGWMYGGHRGTGRLGALGALGALRAFLEQGWGCWSGRRLGRRGH